MDYHFLPLLKACGNGGDFLRARKAAGITNLSICEQSYNLLQVEALNTRYRAFSGGGVRCCLGSWVLGMQSTVELVCVCKRAVRVACSRPIGREAHSIGHSALCAPGAARPSRDRS